MEEFYIKRLGHLGEGIADGPVYAPLTLPGETVAGERTGDRLTDIRIVTPSADRVKPPCRHFKSCGGCLLQHASDAFVAGWKISVVEAALRAQEIDTNVAQIETSPTNSRRRATLSVKRTKKGAMSGFHARGSDVIIEIPDCKLLDPLVLAGREVAEDIAIVAGSRKGALSITITKSLNGLDIHVAGGKPIDGQLRVDMAAMIGRHNLARLAWDGEVIAEAHPAYQQFGKARVVPPPGAFLQATEQGEASLLAQAERQRPGLMVVDSIQTVYSEHLDTAPGAVGQLRECAARIVRFAKQGGTAVFLCSSAADQITGTTISVDGGWTAL